MAQLTIEQAFNLALQHQQSGRLGEAEALYRKILEFQPTHVGAIHYLGVAEHLRGRNDAAVELIGKAIALNPNVPEAHNNLGFALAACGKTNEAIAAHRKALTLRPNYPSAMYNLGIALRCERRTDEAIAAFQQAINLRPNFFEAYGNLGNVMMDGGRTDDAIAAFRQAVAIRPNDSQAHANLGIALKKKGQLNEAIAEYHRAIALKPDNPDILNHLGIALILNGDVNAAINAYQNAITCKPDFAQAYFNLGNALKDKGSIDDAIASYRRAIALQPGYVDALTNLANLLRNTGQLDEALAAYREALALKPDVAEIHGNLGNTLATNGNLDEAIAAYRKAIALDPSYVAAHSNLLYAMNFHPNLDDRAIAQEYERWHLHHAAPLEHLIQPFTNDRDPDRPLRIGYVSADFRDHAVARFALPLLAAHDRNQFQLFCYAQVVHPDAVTHQFQQYAHGWRNIIGKSDSEVAGAIRHDRIDILVDLAGHTSGNRLLVFAQKPAPVQITYLGYPATTGLQTIDYRFTDALADPPAMTDSHCTEQLIRLPETAWCYQPPENSPPVSVLPAIRNDHITFGSFNNYSKINEPLLQLWARILHRVPRSRLLLKSLALRCESVQSHVLQIMSGLGIASDRLDLRSWVAAADHLSLYGEVDIALDTYPYHGTTTTCEALWMGVPVVTLAGQRHASRVGVSLLTNVGLAQLIGENEQQYVDQAVRLAHDLAGLNQLRLSLRQRMTQSVLMDAPRLSRNVEAAYRQMWRSRCR